MNSFASKLVRLSSSPICPGPPEFSDETRQLAGSLLPGLAALLRERNGFFAFEGALHVRPAGGSCQGDLNAWNASHGWRHDYAELAEGCLFFAEDVFGVQFCIHSDRVWSFDPESGAREYLADTVDGWCNAILSDYEVLTGHSLARAWQLANGPLPLAKRLVPKVPFVLGGAFAIENLVLIDAERGMRVRANLAAQIRNLPDGSKVRYQITD